MPPSFEAIAAQAMQLTPAERSELAERLWFSVHARADIDEAWDAEICRRIAQIDAGEVECIPWETVVANQRARLQGKA